MQDNRSQLRERIAKAFMESVEEPEIGREIAFHMTDWHNDLEKLIRLYEHPHTFNDDQLRAIIMEFLVHAPNHVAAARKLAGLGSIEDIFEVGVLEEDD